MATLALYASMLSFLTATQALAQPCVLIPTHSDPVLDQAVRRVTDALALPEGQCADSDVRVLRASNTVEDVYYVGKCRARRGDLLGAMMAWERAANPAGYGLGCTTSKPFYEKAAKRLKEVLEIIPRLQLPKRLAAGTRVTVRGLGELSSCSDAAGCEFSDAAAPLLLNPGSYRVTIRPPGVWPHLPESPEFQMEPRDTLQIPEEWLVNAYLQALLCDQLRQYGGDENAAAVATCYARLGDVTRSARWWTRLLRWVDAELQRTERHARRAELVAVRRDAQRSLDQLPSLRVVGPLARGARLLVLGERKAGTHPSCLGKPCTIQIARNKPLAYGSYALRVTSRGGALIDERRFVLDAAHPKRSVVLPPLTSNGRGLFLPLAVASTTTATILAIQAQSAFDHCKPGRRIECALPWAIATDALWLTSGWLLYRWVDRELLQAEPSSPQPSTRRVSGACGQHSCGITLGGEF